MNKSSWGWTPIGVGGGLARGWVATQRQQRKSVICRAELIDRATERMVAVPGSLCTPGYALCCVLNKLSKGWACVGVKHLSGATNFIDKSASIQLIVVITSN